MGTLLARHTLKISARAISPLADEAEKQKDAIKAAEAQLQTANTAMTDLRSQFDQLTAELRGQLSFKTSELEVAQQQGEALQRQLAAAEEGRQQAEQYCQVRVPLFGLHVRNGIVGSTALSILHQSICQAANVALARGIIHVVT
jgi:predicted RNase H-like nuclease (RuvC/YqgF family)